MAFHPGFPVERVRRLAIHDRQVGVREVATFALSTATGWILAAGVGGSTKKGSGNTTVTQALDGCSIEVQFSECGRR